MGASESRDVMIYNVSGGGILCVLEYTDQKKGPVQATQWLHHDPRGHSPLTVQVDEHQWPGWSWMPVTYGVGTGFPELTITIICGSNFIRLIRSEYYSHLDGRRFEGKIGRFLMYVYEDGLRVGPEPTGWIFKRGTERRTLYPWKTIKSSFIAEEAKSGLSRTNYVLDDENSVVIENAVD